MAHSSPRRPHRTGMPPLNPPGWRHSLWLGAGEGTLPQSLPSARITTAPAVVVLVKPDPSLQLTGSTVRRVSPTIRAPALTRVAALPGPTRGATPVADIVREVGSPPDRARATGRLNLTPVAGIARYQLQATQNRGQRNPSIEGCHPRPSALLLFSVAGGGHRPPSFATIGDA